MQAVPPTLVDEDDVDTGLKNLLLGEMALTLLGLAVSGVGCALGMLTCCSALFQGTTISSGSKQGTVEATRGLS